MTLESVARLANRVLLVSVAGGAAVSCLALTLAIFSHEAVFSVVATTERVDFNGAAGKLRRWVFPKAVLVANGLADKAIDGSVEVHASAKGFIERVAFGDLWVHVECLDPNCTPPLVRWFDTNDQLAGTFDGRSADLFVGGIRAMADEGKTTLLTLIGDISIGRQVGAEQAGQSALLREGTVSVLVKSVFSRRYFESKRFPLDTGDGFSVRNMSPETKAEGFALADERPGLTAAYRFVAKAGLVARPGGADYEVRPSIFQRIAADEFFKVVMGILAFVGAIAAPINLWRNLRGPRTGSR